jgi:hypothetical protein
MPEANTAIEVLEPRRVKARRLDAAARELNLLNISSRRLINVATVGQFVKEIGLLKYGNGRLIGSAQAMQEGAIYAAQMARREGISEEIRQTYLDLELRFLKALDENLVMQLDVNKRDVESSAAASALPQGKPFLPGAQISPIQINISGNAVEAKEQPCKT